MGAGLRGMRYQAALSHVGEEPWAPGEPAPGPGPNSEAPSAQEKKMSRKSATHIHVQVMFIRQ